MSIPIQILRSHSLPADFVSDLLPAAVAEGFKALEWLYRDWQSGVNCFDDDGEAFYAARVGGQLAGVCGLNRDPYSEVPAGRIRRLYVLPSFRRLGVGRRLVLRVIDDGLGSFNIFQLRTFDPEAGAFYLALGFEAVRGEAGVTHRLIIHPPGYES